MPNRQFMKKTILSLTIFFIFSTLACRADFVSREKINEIATEWFGDDDFTVNLDESSSFYYVNAAKGGWILVSAEDATIPVLAYNDTGEFKTDRMPSNIKKFLGGYTKSINAVRQADLKSSSEVKKLWRNAGVRTKTSSGKLLQTAAWGQEDPYNLYCVKVTEGGRQYTALTGCVATSIAIILRYHQWPEHGKGTIGGYEYTSDYRRKVTIPSYSIDDNYYDYSLMPMTYTSSATSAQKNAVATLMHDLGVMFKAEYNYQTGTGAYAEDIQQALFEHMGYSGNAYHLYRNACSSDGQFLRIIKEEIDANRPVPYGGSSSTDGGHQFLCDGYDNKDYVHINWGWSGEDNGYFTLTLKIPNSYTFSDDQSIIVGLEPDRDGSTVNNGGPLCFVSDTDIKDYEGITISSGSIADKNFTAKVGGIWNLDSNVPYKGSVRMAIVDYRGALKEIISETKQITLAGSEYTVIPSISCSFEKTPVLGDRIVAQFLSKNGKWETINCMADYTSYNNAISVIDTPYLLIEDSYKTGDSFILEIVPGNSLISSYTWTFDGLKQSHVSVSPLTKGEHTISVKVTLKDGTIEAITQKIKVE